tara:strand:+ start:340 stop:474 length:135 start_codon:yes stop_codon:yes gene_type:complete
MINTIVKWWNNLTMDPIEKYLSNSADLVDLESRMKNLKRKGVWL